MILPLSSVKQASALGPTLAYIRTSENSLNHNGCLIIYQLNDFSAEMDTNSCAKKKKKKNALQGKESVTNK